MGACKVRHQFLKKLGFGREPRPFRTKTSNKYKLTHVAGHTHPNHKLFLLERCSSKIFIYNDSLDAIRTIIIHFLIHNEWYLLSVMTSSPVIDVKFAQQPSLQSPPSIRIDLSRLQVFILFLWTNTHIVRFKQNAFYVLINSSVMLDFGLHVDFNDFPPVPGEDNVMQMSLNP